MDLASAWLALQDVRLHDPAADALFRGPAYDPLAATVEAERCRATRPPRATPGAPSDCRPAPTYRFLAWWTEDGKTRGWAGTGHGWTGPVEADGVDLTRLDAATLRVAVPHRCEGHLESTVDLHLTSATTAWATLCGARVDLVLGEGAGARRAR